MNIEETLRLWITREATVTALVGQRVYPLVVPEGASLPAIVYRRISTERVYSHDGFSGLAKPRFQFSCVSTHYSEARAVANALRSLLNGRIGPGLQGVYAETEYDDYDHTDRTFTTHIDFFIWYTET